MPGRQRDSHCFDGQCRLAGVDRPPMSIVTPGVAAILARASCCGSAMPRNIGVLIRFGLRGTARLASGAMSLPISFLSDFGDDDEFVGVVHGVLAKLAPESRIIDIGHRFPRGACEGAALALTRAIQYMPEGVCLAVVDPGVGTSRRSDRRGDSMGVLRRSRQRSVVTGSGDGWRCREGGLDRESRDDDPLTRGRRSTGATCLGPPLRCSPQVMRPSTTSGQLCVTTR